MVQTITATMMPSPLQTPQIDGETIDIISSHSDDNAAQLLTQRNDENDLQQPLRKRLANNFEYPESQQKQTVTSVWLCACIEAIKNKLLTQQETLLSSLEELENQRQSRCWSLKEFACYCMLCLEKNKIKNALVILINIEDWANKHNSDGFYNLPELNLLSYFLEKLTSKITDSTLNEFTQLIQSQVHYDWARSTKYTLFHQKMQELAFLSVPESNISNEKGINFIIGSNCLGVIGAPCPQGPFVEGSIGINRINKRRANDEGKIYKEKTTTGSISFTGGCKFGINELAEAGAEGTIGAVGAKRKWKKWGNLGAYVYSKGQKICWANRKSYLKLDKSEQKLLHIQQSLNANNELKTLKKIQEKAQNGQQRLNELASEYCENQSKITLEVPPIERIKPLKGKTKWIKAELKGKAGIKAKFGQFVGIKLDANAKAAVSLSKKIKKEKKPQFLWDKAVYDPNILKHIPKKLISECLQLQESTVQNYQNYLKQLQLQYIEYCHAVQSYDYAKSHCPYWVKNKHVTSTQATKHQLEDKQDCVGRHQVLQHARIKASVLQLILSENKAKYSDEEVNTLQQQLNDFIKIVKNPPITYSKSRLDKISCAHQTFKKWYVDKTIKVSVNASVFNGEITLLHRSRNQSNRLRAGHYLDITLSGSFKASLQDVSSLAEISNIIKNAAASQGFSLAPNFSIAPDIGFESKGSIKIRFFKPDYEMKEDPKGHTKWKHLWTKSIISDGVKLSLPIKVNVHPNVYLGIKPQYKQTEQQVVRETIGTHTIQYYMMFFNRFYTDSKNRFDNNQWRMWLNNYKEQIKQILQHIYNKEDMLNKELARIKEELKNLENQSNHTIKDVDGKFTDFEQKLKKYIQAKNDYENKQQENHYQHKVDNPHYIQQAKCYKETIEALNKILAMQAVPWKSDSDNTWKDKDFKMKSPHDKSTKILMKLGKYKRIK